MYAGIGDPKTYRQVLLTPLGKEPQLLFVGLNVHTAALTSKGSYVFLIHEFEAGNFRLVDIDTVTRQQAILWEGDAQPLSLSVNADGRRLILRLPNELPLWDRSSGWRSLLSHDKSFTEWLLTDNGEIVFAKTSTNRMYRIDANTGEAQQL